MPHFMIVLIPFINLFIAGCWVPHFMIVLIPFINLFIAGCWVPHFMIVLIPFINLFNLSWRIKCLFLRNMEPLQGNDLLPLRIGV